MRPLVLFAVVLVTATRHLKLLHAAAVGRPRDGFLYVTVVFAALGLVAGGTVPFVLKCTKRLHTADHIGVGASVHTTAAEIFAGAAQPIMELAMVGFSQLGGTGATHGPSAIGDAGYGVLVAILLLMSLHGIAGPLLMKHKLIVRASR